MAKQTVNFTSEYGARSEDTNEQNDASIAPVRDGDEITEALLNRPAQVLRQRTEVLRREIANLKYLVDADRAVLLSYDGVITVSEQGSSFSLETDGVMRVRPYIGPGGRNSSGRLVSLGAYADVRSAAATGVVRISASNDLRAYGTRGDADSASSNDYTLTVIVGSAALSFSLEGTPARHVKIGCPTNTSLTALATYLNTSASFKAAGLVATVIGVGSSVVANTLQTGFRGGLDAEEHVITAGGLVSFFTAADGANLLQDGDTLVVGYENIVADGNTGGRRQSIDDAPESNANVDSNLYNLRTRPDMASLAIPVCTREKNTLVFTNGLVAYAGEKAKIGNSRIDQNGGTIEGSLTVEQIVTAPQFQSTVTEAPPLIVASDTLVQNLNADFLRGSTWSEPAVIGDVSPQNGFFQTVDADAVRADTLTIEGRAAVDDLDVSNETTTRTLVSTRRAQLSSDNETDVPLAVSRHGGAGFVQTWHGAPSAPAVADINEKGELAVEKVTSRSGVEVGGPLTGATTGSFSGDVSVGSSLQVLEGSGNFNRVVTDTTGDNASLSVSGSAESTKDTAVILARNKGSRVLSVRGADLQEGSLQTWSLGSGDALIEVDSSGYLKSNVGAELSAPEGSASPALRVTSKSTSNAEVVRVVAGNPAKAALIVSGATTQTAVLQAWYGKNNDTAAVTTIDKSGHVSTKSLALVDALPPASGGTGNSSSLTVNSIVYTLADKYTYLNPGSAGDVLTTQGASQAPQWVKQADLVVGNAANASKLLDATWDSPGDIGTTQAQRGKFTELEATNNITTTNGITLQSDGKKVTLFRATYRLNDVSVGDTYTMSVPAGKPVVNRLLGVYQKFTTPPGDPDSFELGWLDTAPKAALAEGLAASVFVGNPPDGSLVTRASNNKLGHITLPLDLHEGGTGLDNGPAEANQYLVSPASNEVAWRHRDYIILSRSDKVQGNIDNDEYFLEEVAEETPFNVFNQDFTTKVGSQGLDLEVSTGSITGFTPGRTYLITADITVKIHKQENYPFTLLARWRKEGTFDGTFSGEHKYVDWQLFQERDTVTWHLSAVCRPVGTGHKVGVELVVDQRPSDSSDIATVWVQMPARIVVTEP